MGYAHKTAHISLLRIAEMPAPLTQLRSETEPIERGHPIPPTHIWGGLNSELHNGIG